MLPHEFGKNSPKMIRCKFCDCMIYNNEKNVHRHEESLTHKINISKYQKIMRKERIKNEEKKAELDYQMANIHAIAESNYIRQDILKQKDNTALEAFERSQEEIDLAKELYGDEIVEQMQNLRPKKQTETEVYNDIMKSLPSRIQKKYRQPIEKLK